MKVYSTKKEVNWLGRTKDIAEIYSSGMEYCLIDNKLNGMHPYIFCKDFISDVIWSEITLKPVRIYGFEWEPGKLNLLKKRHNIAIRNKDNNIQGNAANLLRFINDVEELMGIPKSKVSIDNKISIIINFSSEWTKIPCHLSMFLLLLRVGIFYTEDYKSVKDFINIDNLKNIKGLNTTNDYIYIKSANTLINDIFYNSIKISQKYEDYDSVSEIHNNSGIVSYSRIVYG